MIAAWTAAIVIGSDRLAHEIEVLDGWHEFYLMAGTAAVTLVGLLFVSLSFNRLDGAEPHERFLGRRRRITMIGHLAAIFIGASMALRRDPYQAYWMVAVVCMQLGNAAGSAWDLLVEVGKLRRKLEPEKR